MPMRNDQLEPALVEKMRILIARKAINSYSERGKSAKRIEETYPCVTGVNGHTGGRGAPEEGPLVQQLPVTLDKPVVEIGQDFIS